MTIASRSTFGRAALGVLATSAAIAVAAPASAATYNNFNGTTGTYGNDVVSPAGDFINSFTFVLGRSGLATATITSSAASTATNIDFTRVLLTGPNGFSQAFANVSDGTFEFRTFERVLQAGTYTLDVRGTSGGAASFTGDFSLAGAVPEPATWGLMILGFGAIGATMRRKKAASALA